MELYVAFSSCEDRVILAHANAHTWEHLCTALTQDDVAWNDDLATVFLNAEAATS